MIVMLITDQFHLLPRKRLFEAFPWVIGRIFLPLLTELAKIRRLRSASLRNGHEVSPVGRRHRVCRGRGRLPAAFQVWSWARGPGTSVSVLTRPGM